MCLEYIRFLVLVEIMFDGKIRNLFGMGKFMYFKNRKIRELVNKVYYNFFEENEIKFDDIFDKLVKFRDKMFKKLGFEDFVEFGYVRMMRSDYREYMIKNVRK